MLLRRQFLALASGAVAARAQMAQNPSPMVEYTRRHPRLEKRTAAGQRGSAGAGNWFVPELLRGKRPIPVLVFFHGGAFIPEIAAEQNRMACVSVQLKSSSTGYAKAAAAEASLPALLEPLESACGARVDRLVLGGWSAGCAGVRALLRQPPVRERFWGAILIDGIHAGYRTGAPGPLDSDLETADLDLWVEVARDAVAGRRRMLVTHSEIFPGTFASTTETADYILRQLGVKRRAVLRWGPMETQQLSEARAGGFLLMGFAGNSAPDHVDQLHSLPAYLRLLRRLG